MGCFDAPGLRIEVVGAIADVLGWPKDNTFISDIDDTAWGVGRQY